MCGVCDRETERKRNRLEIRQIRNGSIAATAHNTQTHSNGSNSSTNMELRELEACEFFTCMFSRRRMRRSH